MKLRAAILPLCRDVLPTGGRAENGVGMAEGFYMKHVRTLSITMIKGLSQQLDADLTIARDNGVQITLHFEVAAKPVGPAAVVA